MNVDSRALLQAVGADLPAVERLLDSGCDPNVADPVSGNTPLYNACFIDRADMVKLLLARGADPNKRMVYRSQVDGRVEDGLVALMLARSADVVAALVNAGADPNMSDADGRTPLMRVVLAATPEAVAQLLQAGADLAARSSAGLTAADIVRDSLQWLHDSWSYLKHPQAQERKLELERILGLLEASGATSSAGLVE